MLWLFPRGPLVGPARESLPSLPPWDLALEERAAGPESLLPESRGKEYGQAGNGPRRSSDGSPGIDGRRGRLPRTLFRCKEFWLRKEATPLDRKTGRDLPPTSSLWKGQNKEEREGGVHKPFLCAKSFASES